MERRQSGQRSVMSVDIEIFTKRTGALTDISLDGEWRDEGDYLETEGNGWLLDIYEPEEVDASDIPSELTAAEPDVRYRIGVTLEPAGSPPEGLHAARQAVDAIGSAWGGAGLDLDTGSVRTWA